MKAPTNTEQSYLKGYAQSLQDIMWKLTGNNTCAKSYDPISFDGVYIHSYAFDFKDGGRHHPIEDYENIDELTGLMLNEAAEFIKEQQH